MIPVPLVRRLLKIRIKLKRSKIFALVLAVVLLAIILHCFTFFLLKASSFTAGRRSGHR
ncbi:hypothetical protein OCC_13875 [Thermococcus litoralis DSM 5473]|uniref:Uncharacterized protein n=1 Tax=Thermococcus litoralis (strain ATCC 51850 / DSM 5473 / JCM 8560 / NS-C) TaxID=523849 RepID=S5ZB14_THELN|nr:hypothetical protein [Thermococcus litoralis]AGT34258.1 hypothetical protein OCC_13875 [Thermococcus litoralis DSM 5473]MDK2854270.1 hypothetical protein [Thermococcaceae archaeon]